MTEVDTEPKGLDNILASALDEHYTEDPSPSVTPDAAQAPSDTPEGRPRDERGRFASTEAKPSEQDQPKPQESAVAQPDPAIKPIEPPRNFTAEDKAVFAKLQREHQEWIARVEGTREAEYTRRSQEAAELRRTAEPLLQAVAPFRDYLTQISPLVGQTPAQMINGILAAEYQLRTGNQEQKQQVFAQLAQAYGVNVGAIPGGQAPQATATFPQQLPQHNPVLQHIQALSQQVQSLNQERKANFDRSISDQITSFENAKDEQGRPKYPHFQRLRSQMALSLANEEVQTLDEAYAKALGPWKEVLDQQAATAKQAAEKESALEKAKRAASPKGSAGLPNGSTSAKGLDAHISAAMSRAGL